MTTTTTTMNPPTTTKVEIVGLARFGLVSGLQHDDDDTSCSESLCENSCKLAARRVSTRTEEDVLRQTAEIIHMMEASFSSIGDDESVSFQDSFVMHQHQQPLSLSPIRNKRRSSLDNYNNFQGRRASIGSGVSSTLMQPHRRSSMGSNNNYNRNNNNNACRRLSMGSVNNNHNMLLQRNMRANRRSSLGSTHSCFANDSLGGYRSRVNRRSSLGSCFDDSYCSNSFANDSLELHNKQYATTTATNNKSGGGSCCGGSMISISSSTQCPLGNRAA